MMICCAVLVLFGGAREHYGNGPDYVCERTLHKEGLTIHIHAQWRQQDLSFLREPKKTNLLWPVICSNLEDVPQDNSSRG